MARNDIDRDEVLRLIAEGVPRKDLAKRFGMSASSFSHWCRVRKIPPAPGNVRTDDRGPMPEDLDVRTLDDRPHLLFGANGRIYDTRFDPPRERLPTRKADGRLKMKSGKLHLSVARDMCRAWHGEPDPGDVVEHIDGDRSNILPTNLRWTTPRHSVPAAEFVKVWQTSYSAVEAADRMGLSAASATLRASQLRKRGIPLKSFSKRGDIDDLIRLAEELGGDE